MSIFGVSAAEEELYRHFLRNPDTAIDELRKLGDDAGRDADHCLERLRHLGLIHPTGAGGRITPADPEVAVARLTDARLHALLQEVQRVTQSRHIVQSLRSEQGAWMAPQGIEQLHGLEEIRNRIEDLAFFARDEILSVEPYTRLSAENIERSRPLDLRCLRRGIRIRNVVLRAALDHAPTADYLRELAAEGAVIKVAENISERILVYDGRTALVPLDPQNTSRGALLARSTGLVSNIIALFEKIWSQADELPTVAGAETRPDAGEQGLTGTERRVLLSMCSVGKDETGARDLGVSVRTYRRHVADIMQKLGAANRAHAALLARERGWV
ncbi:LuxR C-terminal-related transcriptional regulator [Streptomyces sp. NBC_01619]|uniref:helix-turn-helix transcriptional regulator n=1 Tax=unclassified Streptomyces TaxID=2593676 RepID=UPI00225155BC|nr:MULTISPECIES: LuxR family transcriptional regulator [unclassified Streptomyces]MCX4510730.1 LuxR C-terminal-related transcriptional regulator [Streptomyces sp. NBC_01619]